MLVPTGPRALQKKFTISSPAVTSSAGPPKGPRALGFGGSSAGGKAVRKFFPGDDEEEDEVEAVAPPVKKGGWVTVDTSKEKGRGRPGAVGGANGKGEEGEQEKPMAEGKVDGNGVKTSATAPVAVKGFVRAQEATTTSATLDQVEKAPSGRSEVATFARKDSNPPPPSVPTGPRSDREPHNRSAIGRRTPVAAQSNSASPGPIGRPQAMSNDVVPSSARVPTPAVTQSTPDLEQKPLSAVAQLVDAASQVASSYPSPATSVPIVAPTAELSRSTPVHAVVPPPAPVPTTAPTPAPAVATAPTDPTELYDRIAQVGEGTYGKVYKAKNVETGALVALKRIRMEAEKDGFPVTAIREIKLLQGLRHVNVVDLIEMLVSKGHVYMVFEYLENDLTGLLNHPSINFSPGHLKSLMQQFLQGLGFIHRRGVLHRDLKGSNILISRTGELKIADFGLARFYKRGRRDDYTNRVITQWYKPPELLFGATAYGADVDMWSAGCIFLELFTRRPVFQGQDEIHQLEVIFKITGTPRVETWPGVEDLPWYELVKPKTIIESQLRKSFTRWLTPAGLDLAERLLSLNPAGRPLSEEALQMPYFSEDPVPEMPTMLSTIEGEWHEYESKRARRKEREEAAARL